MVGLNFAPSHAKQAVRQDFQLGIVYRFYTVKILKLGDELENFLGDNSRGLAESLMHSIATQLLNFIFKQVRAAILIIIAKVSVS